MHQVARVVVRGAADAVDGRVAQVDVGLAMSILARSTMRRRHACRRASRESAPGSLPGCGCGRGCPRRACRSRRGWRASLGGLLVHIGVAGFDQVFGRAVHEVEVVAGLVQVAFAAVEVPSQSPATAPRRGWSRRIPCLPSRGWCRQSAGGRRRRSRAPGRSSGRCSWRGPRAGSRWARAGSGCGSWPGRAGRRRGGRRRRGCRPSGGWRRCPRA
jgi:hypothetical protein